MNEKTTTNTTEKTAKKNEKGVILQFEQQPKGIISDWDAFFETNKTTKLLSKQVITDFGKKENADQREAVLELREACLINHMSFEEVTVFFYQLGKYYGRKEAKKK